MLKDRARGDQFKPAWGKDRGAVRSHGMNMEWGLGPTSAEGDTRRRGKHLEGPAAIQDFDVIKDQDANFVNRRDGLVGPLH